MSDPSTFACSLDEAGARSRLSQARALTARLRRRERTDDRLVLELVDDGDTVDLVEEFVRDEKRCCPFFDFDVRRGDGRVVLQLSAPAGGEHMLDAAMSSFDPERSDADRLALQRAASSSPTSDASHGDG